MAGFTRYSDYDRFAWVYDRHWGSGERRLPALERLMLRHLGSDARILDLCCGTGHGTQAIVATWIPCRRFGRVRRDDSLRSR